MRGMNGSRNLSANYTCGTRNESAIQKALRKLARQIKEFGTSIAGYEQSSGG